MRQSSPICMLFWIDLHYQFWIRDAQKCNNVHDNYNKQIIYALQLSCSSKLDLGQPYIFLLCWVKIKVKKLLFVLLVLLKPWNVIMGVADPGQISSPRETHVSTRRSALHAPVASFFVWHVKGCACGQPRSYRFCKGSGLGSSRPDVIVSVRWHGQAEPTLWLEGAKRQVAVKSWNSLSACFYGLVSSIQQKKFFTPIIFFMSNSVQAYMTPSLYLV